MSYQGGFLGLSPPLQSYNGPANPTAQQQLRMAIGSVPTIPVIVPTAAGPARAVKVVPKVQKQTLVAVIILAVLTLAIMTLQPKDTFHEMCIVRVAASYKLPIAAGLSLLILILVARMQNIAKQYTNWIPYLPSEGYHCGGGAY